MICLIAAIILNPKAAMADDVLAFRNADRPNSIWAGETAEGFNGGTRELGIGLGAGFVAAAVLSTLLRTYLFGVPLIDFYAYTGAAGILGLAGLLATWIPARRATRIDPMTALRYE